MREKFQDDLKEDSYNNPKSYILNILMRMLSFQ
jgi:hypothetical protein